MGINPGDIISTLQVLGMIKYWKGQHVILKKEDLIDEYLEKSRSRPKHRQVGYWIFGQIGFYISFKICSKKSMCLCSSCAVQLH